MFKRFFYLTGLYFLSYAGGTGLQTQTLFPNSPPYKKSNPIKLTGFISGFGGFGAGTTGELKAKLHDTTTTPPTIIEDLTIRLGKTVFLGGAEGGIGVCAKGWQALLTVEAGFSPWEASTETQIFSRHSAIKSKGFFWGTGLRFGYTFQEWVTPYVKIGMRQKKWSAEITDSSNPTTIQRITQEKSLSSFSTGLGFNWHIMPCLTIGVEGTMDFYGKHSSTADFAGAPYRLEFEYNPTEIQKPLCDLPGTLTNSL